MRTICSATLLLPLLTLAAACGTKTGDPVPTTSPTPTPTAGPFDITTVNPAEVKADFDGDLTITGVGFSAATQVLVNGTNASAVAGFTLTQLDAYNLDLHHTYGGAGMEMPAGDYSIQAVDGNQQSSVLNLHVRPILTSMTWVRTLPGQITTSGGFLDLWVIPTDSMGVFMGPLEEVTPIGGMTAGNFTLTNVTLTDSAGNKTTPNTAGIASVVYAPVGTAKPLAVALTIDMSGSMIGLGSNPVPSDPNEMRIAQSEGFVNRMGPMDQAEVVSFAGGAGAYKVVVPMTSNKATLIAGLESLKGTEGGNTPLYDAIYKSVSDVFAVKGPVTPAVIVLTDGRDDTSTTTPSQVINLARTDSVPVLSIGLGNPNDATSLDRTTLQTFADQTGGRFFYAADPSVLPGIYNTLTALLTDSYDLQAAIDITPALPAAGPYKLDGTVVCNIDGEQVSVTLPTVGLSVQ